MRLNLLWLLVFVLPFTVPHVTGCDDEGDGDADGDGDGDVDSDGDGDGDVDADADADADLSDGDAESPSDDVRNLPLLAAGSHVGMIVGFNGILPVSTTEQVEARWQEALSAGMQIGRVQVDWGEIEPNAGEWDMEPLTEPLEQLTDDGLQPFLSLGTYEDLVSTGEQFVPADLQERITGGEIGWDHPDVVERFHALLDRIIPVLLSHNGWVISLGNEAGNRLDDLPAAQRQSETEQLVALWGGARDHIRSIEPRLAVTVTIREQETETELPFVEVSDVVTFNFYCSRFDDDLRPETDPARIRGYMDQMLTHASGKPVILQELGCHGGYEDRPSVTAASLALQTQFFEVVFDELATRPEFRAAVVFQLVDWDPDLVESFYSQPLRDAGIPETFIRQYAESLETIGLLRFEDGTARPAWTTFLDAL